MLSSRPSFHISHENCWKELFSAKRPFESVPHGRVKSCIRQRQLPERPFDMDDEWWELCTSCWALEPALRPSMLVIVEEIENVRALKAEIILSEGMPQITSPDELFQ